MSLQSDMDLYIEGLESPVNAWGVHYVKSWDGDVQSHGFLAYMMKKYGRDAVDSELNKRFNREVIAAPRAIDNLEKALEGEDAN